MASRPGPPSQVWLAILMAACAGFVDVACFFRLAGIFGSFMTGNSSHFAYNLSHRGSDPARYGWALASYALGLLFSASLEQVQRRNGIRSSFAAILFLECILLALYIRFSASPSSPLWLLIFLICFSLGMQTVTITHAGPIRVWTTFQTGNLANFAESLSAWLFWFRDRTRGRFRRRAWCALRLTPRQMPARHAAATAIVWSGYFSGAFAGGIGESAWGAISLWLPIATLAAIAALDLRRPRALGEPAPKH